MGLIFSLVISQALSPLAQAKTLDNRSIVTGSQLPSATTTHDYSFFVQSLDDIGSIVFEYCTNSAVFTDPCDTPIGINVTGASLNFQSGNTGFSVDNVNTTSNKLIIKRPTAAAAVIQTEYNFGNIVNPSTPNIVVYVRISTHGSTDGSGANIDTGAVAFATNSVFEVGAFVPPFLQACAGLSVAADCSSSSGTILDLGILSASHTATGTSQFADATNSPSGAAVYGLGTTLTSGNNEITALSTNAFSAPGTSQFGINLRANVVPQVGAEPNGPGTSSPTAGYNSVNQFRYNSGEMLVQSPIPTDYRTFTVSYIANVGRNMPPGIYSTSLTFLAVAEF